MADRMATALAWLEEKRAANLTQTVTYTRSGSSPLSVAATIGAGRGMTAFEEAIRTQSQATPFLVAASELESIGEPIRGDTIDVTHDGVTHRYEVTPNDDGRCWRWSDPINHTRYRIHTRYAGTT